VYVVHTNSDLIGLGESDDPLPDETLQKYLGSNPFDWIADDTNLSLGMAMYVSRKKGWSWSAPSIQLQKLAILCCSPFASRRKPPPP